MFAAPRFGARKMPSRTSGSRRLAWSGDERAEQGEPRRRATSQVCAEPQPTSGARTMA